MKQTLTYITCLLLTSITLHSQSPTIINAKNGDVKVERMDILNSPFRETNISITPSARYLFFMTGRGGNEWSSENYTTFKDKPEFDGDIFMSEKIEGKWTKPKAIGTNINTMSGEDEPVISQDGQKVYFQSWMGNWQGMGGPYYSSNLDGMHWRTKTPMGGGINQMFVDSSHKISATDGMTVSPDQQTFIVAAGHDYDGDLDLFISKKKDGEWSYLKKHPTSTDKDERSVFLAADGKSLYFASSGYGGKGGLDIFKAKLHDDGSIDEIVNLGAPFNTKHDDYGFIVAGNGYEAYFVRDGDIYHADLSKADPLIKPSKTIILNGKVHDSNGKPAKAVVQIEMADGTVVTTGTTNKITGEFSVSIPEPVKDLKIKITSGEDIKYYDLDLLAGDNEVIKDFIIEQNQPEHIILFEFDNHFITAKEKEKLNVFVSRMKLHPESIIQLSGHTCSDGNHEYNVELSENRAKRIYNQMVELGIPKHQIQVSFHGSKQPAETNSHASGKESNRRVEISIK
ncbi:MAG: outer membrane protein OmpA-like peptidoglycan-associated protein [Parvicellaceae bacterium]|jgi:outer membrane protein OmpA-like peptidoglycan-associated protein